MFRFSVTLMLMTVLFLGFCQAQSEPDTAYHTYEEVLTYIDHIVEAFPELVYKESLTVSTRDSIPVWAVKVSDNPYVDEDEPSVLITGGIHAEELVGVEVCIYLMDLLTSLYGIDEQVTKWVDSLQIWIIPVVNPEGHGVVTSGLDITFRKNKRDNNLNGIFDFTPGDGGDSDGVDLNRNFDINWEDGISDMSSHQYRGPSAASENEIQAVQNLALREKFISAIFYHSSSSGFYNEKVIYPWNWLGHMPPYPDYQTLYFFAESIAVRLEKVSEVGTYDTYISLTPNGNSNDWLYANLGTIPFIIEIDTCTQPDAERLAEACLSQLQGLEFFMNRSLGSGIWGHITDADSGTPIVAQITVLEAASTDHLPRLSDPDYGSFHRIIKPGDYNLLIEKDEYRSDTISITVNDGIPTAIDIELQFVDIRENENVLPSETNLYCYPNPFNSKIRIDYSIVNTVFKSAQLNIFDLLGNKIFSETVHGDQGSITWCPDNSASKQINSGLYFITFSVGAKTLGTNKVLYLK
ncbi:hypothetical protein JXI42_06620 [bacterium]|nr:hypothetical protein [bacterium]